MSDKIKFTTTLHLDTIEKLEELSNEKYKTNLKKNEIIEYLVDKEMENKKNNGMENK